MKIVELPGITRTLGEEQGYRALPIIDTMEEDGTRAMISGWVPTQEEIKALQNGGVILLMVYGDKHPPVRLEVTKGAV